MKLSKQEIGMGFIAVTCIEWVIDDYWCMCRSWCWYGFSGKDNVGYNFMG